MANFADLKLVRSACGGCGGKEYFSILVYEKDFLEKVYFWKENLSRTPSQRKISVNLC
jgi:hypothetical protein